MEIKSRPLNEGETFPCSFKTAKSIFKDTAVFLDFAYLGRSYAVFANTPDAYYLKHKIKGYIVASMNMQPREERSILSFYVVRKRDFLPSLQTNFEKKYLPEFYDFYQRLLHTDTWEEKAVSMLVELADSELKSHIVRW